MYELCKDIADVPSKCVKQAANNAFIPFDSANTDYQQFKANIEAGAELQDAEGNPMSQEAAIEFVRGLP